MRLHGVLVMHPETLQWWDASSSSAWLRPRLKASSMILTMKLWARQNMVREKKNMHKHITPLFRANFAL